MHSQSHSQYQPHHNLHDYNNIQNSNSSSNINHNNSSSSSSSSSSSNTSRQQQYSNSLLKNANFIQPAAATYHQTPESDLEPNECLFLNRSYNSFTAANSNNTTSNSSLLLDSKQAMLMPQDLDNNALQRLICEECKSFLILDDNECLQVKSAQEFIALFRSSQLNGGGLSPRSASIASAQASSAAAAAATSSATNAESSISLTPPSPSSNSSSQSKLSFYNTFLMRDSI
jgi:hypothetical protein